MSPWPHDDPRARAAFYGDPALNQVDAQLVWVKPPFQMYYEGKPIDARGFKFHRKAAPALLRVLNRIWDECNHDQMKVDAAGVSDFCGAYNKRKIRGRENERDAWSSHAYGAAIDINAKGNALGNPHGNMPAFVVAAFKSEGFRWGGDYHGRKDFMHFEGVDNGLPDAVAPAPKPKPVEAPKPKPAPAPVPIPREENEAPPEPSPAPVPATEDNKPWYKKVWSWVAGGGIGSLGIGGSMLSGVEPLTVGIIVGALLIVFLVVWFTKKGNGW
jgi:hypothetical protein